MEWAITTKMLCVRSVDNLPIFINQAKFRIVAGNFKQF